MPGVEEFLVVLAFLFKTTPIHGGQRVEKAKIESVRRNTEPFKDISSWKLAVKNSAYNNLNHSL
jgi:hypothetical protein